MWASHGAFAGNHFLLGGLIPSLSGEISYPGLFDEKVSGTKWHLRTGYRPSDSARLSDSYMLSTTRDIYFSVAREIGTFRLGTYLGDMGISNSADDDFERTVGTFSGAVWLETPWAHFPGAGARGNYENLFDSKSSYDSLRSTPYSCVVKGSERNDKSTAGLRSGSLRFSISPEHLPAAAVIGYDTEGIRRDDVMTKRVFYRYPNLFSDRDTLYDTISAYFEEFVSYQSQRDVVSARLLLLPDEGPTSVITLRASLTRYRWSTGFDTTDYRFTETEEGYLPRLVSGDYYRKNMWESAEAGIELFECFPFAFEPLNIFVGLRAGLSLGFLSFESGKSLREQVGDMFSEFASSKIFASVPILIRWEHRGFVILSDWKPGYYSNYRRKQYLSDGTRRENWFSTRNRKLLLDKYSFSLGYEGYKCLVLWIRPEFGTKLRGIACEVGVKW